MSQTEPQPSFQADETIVTRPILYTEPDTFRLTDKGRAELQTNSATAAKLNRLQRGGLIQP